jgi:hypothetical protein
MYCITFWAEGYTERIPPPHRESKLSTLLYIRLLTIFGV